MKANLGPACLSRDEWIAHNSAFCDVFYKEKNEKKLFLIGDGTYLYCQKSFDNEFQRRSYSVQKKSHLVKPFVLCSSDGLIVDIYGFFSATMNDASILLKIFSKNPDLIRKFDGNNQECGLLREGDTLILDRGFRDAVNSLENDYKLQVKMPHLLDKGQKQFTTEQANKSRLCTKIRWVVETTNSLLKQKFRALDSTVQNKALPHFLDDFRIAGALINKFSKRLSSDAYNQELIAHRMFGAQSRKNELQEIVADLGLHRKSQFKDIDVSEIIDFPKLTLETLSAEITFGSFQLKFGPSYINEFIKKNGVFRLCSSKALNCSSKVVSAQVHSRHSSMKKYRVYIQYQPQNSIKENNSAETIVGWYCECKNGSRTLGCCCHVGSILLYLSYGRHIAQQKNPGNYLNSVLCDFDVDEEADRNSELNTQTQCTQSSRKNPKRKGFKISKVIFNLNSIYNVMLI